MYIFVFNRCVRDMLDLNFENSMWDMGKGTYLVVGDSGNGEMYSAAAN